MDAPTLPAPPILLRYRARTLGPADLAFIQATIAAHAAAGRTRISQVLCAAWNWRRPDGALKEYACRDLLLRLEERGYVTLPPRLRAPAGPCQQDRLGPPPPPGPPLTTADLHTVVVRPVAPAERPQWKACLAHYHYLGYQPGAGEPSARGGKLRGRPRLSWVPGSAHPITLLHGSGGTAERP